MVLLLSLFCFLELGRQHQKNDSRTNHGMAEANETSNEPLPSLAHPAAAAAVVVVAVAVFLLVAASIPSKSLFTLATLHYVYVARVVGVAKRQ